MAQGSKGYNISTPGYSCETFPYNSWTVTAKKSHILFSKCSTPLICDKVKEKENFDKEEVCLLCKYNIELDQPRLPDMTFASNLLEIRHDSGYGFQFNCLDALRLIDNNRPVPAVSPSAVWKQARNDSEHLQSPGVSTFDWTFTSDYKGTVICENSFKICPTDERIDIEKLKVREQIMFYDDIHLFEDELADNGVSQLSVKIRVMKNSFFILLRFFLRVDNVMARINDTRLYHEFDKSYILREFTSRECDLKKLEVPIDVLREPAQLAQHLPLVSSSYEKLEIISS